MSEDGDRAPDEAPTHARLTKFASEVANAGLTSTSEKASHDALKDVNKYARRWYSLNPDSGFRGKWDLSQAVILLYVALVVPFRVGYRQPAESGWYVLDLLIDLYFYVDVVLNFYTGFVDPDDEERIIYEPTAIAKEYARSWLFIDLIACLPIDLAIRISEGRLLCSVRTGGCPSDLQTDSSGQALRLFKLLRLFRLMKLLRLARIARLFERYQDDLFEYLHFFAVVKLVVIMLYMGHLFGCFFHYFSVDEWRTAGELMQIENGALTPWLKDYFDDTNPDVANVWDRYIASIYWAFTTMTTVGYGDISSVTRSERVVACFGMLVGGFVFSAVIGTMSDVVAAADLSKKAHTQKMEAVSAFIRDNQLPQEYYKEMLAFFRKQKVAGYDRRALLNDLPYRLRKKILYHTYSDVIAKTPLFDVDDDSGDGSDNHVFVTELCSRLRPVSYPSGQLIYQRGEIGRHMFILTSGRVEVLDTAHKNVLTTLAPGAYFGEGCVLGDVRRRENVRALGHVDVCQLVSHELDDLLDTYPHLHRALKTAYFKRKAILDRFEKARIVDQNLTLHRFLRTEMRAGDKAATVDPTAEARAKAAEAENANDSSEEDSSMSENGRAGTAEADAARNSSGLNRAVSFGPEPGGSKDPTLEFDLTDSGVPPAEQDLPSVVLSRTGSSKEGNRKLELKVLQMEEQLKQTLEAVKRVESILTASKTSRASFDDHEDQDGVFLKL